MEGTLLTNPMTWPQFVEKLQERAEWLRYEIRGGGNYEHLSAREQECRYITELARDVLSSLQATKISGDADPANPVAPRGDIGALPDEPKALPAVPMCKHVGCSLFVESGEEYCSDHL